MFYQILYSLRVASDELIALTQNQISPDGYLLFFIMYLIFDLLIFGVYYTFRSIGLYKMAKNYGFSKPLTAIIPFYGIYVINKLSPDSKYIKKNNVLYIIAIVCGAVYLLSNILLDAFYGVPALIEVAKGNILTYDTLGTKTNFVRFFTAYSTLLNVAYTILLLIILKNLFMSYTINKSSNYVFLSALVFFFTDTLILAGILIFTLRNKPRINYDAYIEARQKWAQRNMNGGPYGGQYSYGNNTGSNYNNGEKPREVNPFEEFDSNSNNSENSSNNDDFFN